MKNIYNISEKYKKYMDINFEYYKIFYYVAKYKNMTKAAAALGGNQPNVSRIIKLLESQLHCKLFLREARGIRLTEKGELLYSHVELAYRHLLNAQEEISRQDSPDCGIAEIGTTATALHLFLLHVLRDFRLEYPGIKIKIHNNTTPEILRQLINDKLDFAVITSPFDLPSNFSCVKVLDFKEMLVGGTEYKHLCKTPLTFEDFQKYPWIGLGRETATYQLYRDFFAKQRIDIEPDMEVETSGLMIPMIENNLGIGFIPETLAMPLLKEKKLVKIPICFEMPMHSIHIVSDHGSRKSLAAATLHQYLKKQSQPSA